MTPERVVLLLLAAMPEAEVTLLVWKWVRAGVLVESADRYEWSEQRQKGGTIRW